MDLKKRDEQLPAEREKLILAIEANITPDENILSVFYGGSIGAGNTDLYSDIDVRIVVKEDVYEQYVLSKQSRARNWGDVLFFEDFPGTTYTVAHYDCFVKVDCFYYRAVDLKPSVWLKDIKIVKDTDQIMTVVAEESKKLSFNLTKEDVEVWRTKFFAYIHEVYRRVKRGEIYYALSCLDHLRFSLTSGWYMEKGIQPNSFGDWAKIEGPRSYLNDWQQSLLKEWEGSLQPDHIMHVMKQMIPEFIRVHKVLCEKVSLIEDRQRVDNILGKVFQALNKGEDWQ
ncbi:hypothetical protein [Evansella halocellulosilytica]|uniref:hypothetical protein n=1 Tax=Evansella halocellulosilytica TaxID=2011013 RepID=UPI000BB99ED5|nr:hypothetical protein [Evansella halocellulosilytica]